jgi:hypothetical protein
LELLFASNSLIRFHFCLVLIPIVQISYAHSYEQ